MTRPLHGWRKLAGSTWSAPRDPQFYGDMEIDAANLLRFLHWLRRDSGEHVTVTHLAVRAVAHALSRVPDLNVRLARGREYARESIDVFVIVAAGCDELTGIKVHGADKKSAVAIAHELGDRVARIRAGTDPEFGRTKALLTLLPPWLLRPALRLSAFLTSDLNLNAPRLGLPRQAFGSAMVSSIGLTGVSHAYSPLAPYYRVPLLVLVGAVQEKPVVVSGQVIARPVLSITATFDHRYTDGLRAAEFAQAMRDYLTNPERYEAALPVPEQRRVSSVTPHLDRSV